MTEEQTKTQTLLTILQAKAWTKAERASVRQEINRYYERKLASLQESGEKALSIDGGDEWPVACLEVVGRTASGFEQGKKKR